LALHAGHPQGAEFSFVLPGVPEIDDHQLAAGA
jgi:hypothetical protein